MYRVRYNSIAKRYEFDEHMQNTWVTVMKGTLTQVTKYAMHFIDKDELTFAYEQMNKNKHTVAEFGIFGKFIFSRSA